VNPIKPLWNRRNLLGQFGVSGLSGLSGLSALGGGLALPVAAAPVTTLRFPRDHGAHLDFTTEWWYATGYAEVDGVEAAFGFQVTFFRRRIASTQAMASNLAARHLLVAHAALTDVRGGKLWHAQRSARWSGTPGGNATDLAWASTSDLQVHLQDWSLQQSGEVLTAQVRSPALTLALTLHATQGLLLQGDQGLSRKGPDATQTSYYTTLPQLQVRGTLTLQGRQHTVGERSRAWLDHEWSQALLHPLAVGWDWVGINLFDGSALTAFQLRTASGAALWDGGSVRTGASLVSFAKGAITFAPQRLWQSPQTRATYPVQWLLRTPIGVFTITSVLDNQELDSRASTGAIYWEGLCEVHNAERQLVGRGYLEMTGYVAPLQL